MIGGKPERVDREKGIIYRVKILGRRSPNTHKVKGAESTEYTLEAMQQAIPLYEGLSVNVDHPDRDNPGKDRSSRDRIGWITDVEVDDTGMYGNLNLLLADPLSTKLFEAAERRPQLFGLSHNALGRGEVRNGVYTIVEIPEARSVDVVADGGTVTSLYESRHQRKDRKPMKIKLAKLLESVKVEAKAKTKLTKLLEDMGDLEYDAPEPEAGSEATLEDHLSAAVSAILADKSMDLAAKKAKIAKLVEMAHPDETPTKKVEESEEDDEDEGKKVVESEEEDDEDPKKKKLEESRKKPRKVDPAVRELQERLNLADLKDWIRSEADTKKVACPKALLESLVLMRDKTKIGEHLDYLVSLATQSTGKRPRSQGAGTTSVTESRGGAAGTGTEETPEATLASLRS